MYRCDLCWEEFDTEEELRLHVGREDDKLYSLGIAFPATPMTWNSAVPLGEDGY